MVRRKYDNYDAELTPGGPVAAASAAPSLSEAPKPQRAARGDLQRSLTRRPAEPDADLERAVQRAIDTGDADLDLSIMDEGDLIGQDTALQARLAYVCSYIKLLQFLRRPHENFMEHVYQTKVAISFIRHAEQNMLEVLQIGRNQSDEALVQKATELRSQLMALGRQRATETVEAAVVEP